MQPKWFIPGATGTLGTGRARSGAGMDRFLWYAWWTGWKRLLANIMYLFLLCMLFSMERSR